MGITIVIYGNHKVLSPKKEIVYGVFSIQGVQSIIRDWNWYDIKYLKTNNKLECVESKFMILCKQEGSLNQHIVAHTPQHNGVVE